MDKNNLHLTLVYLQTMLFMGHFAVLVTLPNGIIRWIVLGIFFFALMGTFGLRFFLGVIKRPPFDEREAYASAKGSGWGVLLTMAYSLFALGFNAYVPGILSVPIALLGAMIVLVTATFVATFIYRNMPQFSDMK